MAENKTTEVKINAEGRQLGRVASEIAVVLRGKNSAGFERNVRPETKVIVENASKINFGAKKMKEKIYRHYSGYPGGMKSATLAQVIDKRGPAEALRLAVYGMLPDNKLRAVMMNNLKIID